MNSEFSDSDSASLMRAADLDLAISSLAVALSLMI